MKIAIETLGCKLNQAETELLARQFRRAGHRLVDSVEEADIYVLNTCTVTGTADAKARQLLRQARKRNTTARLVAAGCYASRAPEELSRIEGVFPIEDRAAKADLVRTLEAAGVIPADQNPENKDNTSPAESRTRAMLKIQEGCDAFCTYCIVPLVRGGSKSVPADEVIALIKEKVAEGYREVVLTGTEIGLYRDGDTSLKELLERTLRETTVERLRISSLQPDEITPDLLDLWRDKRLCPHFHISLQSGSDSVLKRMNRRYRTADYLQTLESIREKIPEAAVTTDIITGFPGETEAEFEESYATCRRAGFARMHVFPYSPREGTAAARMPFHSGDSARTPRNENLRALASECAHRFIQTNCGRVTDVLWEKESGGRWTGHTPNYIKVYTESDTDLANRITPVKLVKPYKDGAWGEISP